MRAIVLSGGGAKGAYEIGVWKALRKMNIDYDIVTGTSVGALNASLMTQRDYLKAVLLWFNLSNTMVYDKEIKIENSMDIIKYTKDIFLDGGMKISNLEKTVEKYINIRKIYRSPINLGIVTVKYPSLKPLKLTKNQIKPEQLKDYLIASASCFPAFQKKTIDGKDYIDGGIYDNLPINLAIDLGATEVIAVDLEALGIKRKVKNKEIPVTIITPNNDIGSMLVFDKSISRRVIALGYNDAMKVYGKLEGIKLTFKIGQLDKSYEKYHKDYLNTLKNVMASFEGNVKEKILSMSLYKKMFLPKATKKEKEAWIHFIEEIGISLKIDETKIYTNEKYHKELFKQSSKISIDELLEHQGKLSLRKMKLLFHDDLMITYLYKALVAREDLKEIEKYILLFPTDFLKAIYLYMIQIMK